MIIIGKTQPIVRRAISSEDSTSTEPKNTSDRSGYPGVALFGYVLPKYIDTIQLAHRNMVEPIAKTIITSHKQVRYRA